MSRSPGAVRSACSGSSVSSSGAFRTPAPIPVSFLVSNDIGQLPRAEVRRRVRAMSATIDHPRPRVVPSGVPTAHRALEPGRLQRRTTIDRISRSLKRALEKTKDAFRRNGSSPR